MKDFKLFPEKFGVLPYVFLVYLVFPLLYMLEEDGWKAAIGYGLLLLFLVTYRQLYQAQSDRLYTVWLLILVGIIAALSLFYNPYNLFLGFFPANFLAWYDEEKQFRRAIGGFALFLVAMLLFFTMTEGVWNGLLFLPFAIVMLLSPYALRSHLEKAELAERLEEANEQIAALIKREERVRIARDLHDTLGHTLSLLSLQSQLVQRTVDRDPARAKEEAKTMERTTRAALAQVRTLVSEMREVRLFEALAEMEEALSTANVEFRLEGSGDLPVLPPVQENMIGMCLKELTTNIVRHSGASVCTVSFIEQKGRLDIRVHDDGIGLGGTRFGNGLTGIRERLGLIEATLDIAGTDDRGTDIRIVLPVLGRTTEREEVKT